jgi:hypothetical protein
VSVHGVDLVSEKHISSFVFLGFVYNIKYVLDEVKGRERHGCCFYIWRERADEYKVDG